MRNGEKKKPQQTLVEKVDTTRDERRDNSVVLINRAPKVLLFVSTAPEHRPLVALSSGQTPGCGGSKNEFVRFRHSKFSQQKKEKGKKSQTEKTNQRVESNDCVLVENSFISIKTSLRLM